MAEVEIKVIGLGGSLAQHSASLAALAIALKGAREAGAQVELFDVRKLNLRCTTQTTAKFRRQLAIWQMR